jgi:hypothetical protein
MDAVLFSKMLHDKNFLDLKKMRHKYSPEYVDEMSRVLRENFYKRLPLPDFKGDEAVYLDSFANVRSGAVRAFGPRRGASEIFGAAPAEDEIFSTLSIENISSSRESIRKILRGGAPSGDDENRVYGMKRGLEFISDTSNAITEENLHRLYRITIDEFLGERERLAPGNFYRHDAVYVVGADLKHSGLPHHALPGYMRRFVKFAEDGGGPGDLAKAAILHFYLAYLHPYFDGNGRMARLVHLWHLARRGYESALFVPLSLHISRSRKKYYDAFTLTERNAKITGTLDVSPFLSYFAQSVYGKLEPPPPAASTDIYKKALEDGAVTEKERDLWEFALSSYGGGEFSTKTLERDFGAAAYATIRSFVIKFERLGLLETRKYGVRVKYMVKGGA